MMDVQDRDMFSLQLEHLSDRGTHEVSQDIG